MYNLISCEHNVDTGCMELWFLSGPRISINCIAVENVYPDNLYQRSELDYLIY